MKRLVLMIILVLGFSDIARATVFSKYLDSDKIIERTPEELTQDYKDGLINSSQLWMKMPLNVKINLIDLLKKRFEEDDDVIISNSSEGYAMILMDLYNEHPEFLKESIKPIFAAVAMQNNDFYQENMDLEESIMKWFGDNFLIIEPKEVK